MKNHYATKLSLPLLLFMLMQGQVSFAQDNNSYPDQDGKNQVKLNVTSLLLKTYVFQYERALGEKTSLALGFSFMPKSGPPLKSKIEDMVDDQETWDRVKDYKTSNFAFTPEFRYYLGKGVFHGFYIAPFARFAKYSVDVPFHYSYTGADNTTVNETLPMNGDINTFTGGILFGAQWKLSKLVYLDWWILGPNYGTSSGSLTGVKSLNDREQTELRSQLADIGHDIPLVDTKYNVDGNGVKVDVDGPWAGVRAGVNIGFRF